MKLLQVSPQMSLHCTGKFMDNYIALPFQLTYTNISEKQIERVVALATDLLG